MVQRTLLNLLRLLLLGTEHRWCEDPIESAPFIRAQARKARAPLFSLGFFFFHYYFLTIRAFLGGLTWSKTLENVHTHWNPRQLGRRWGWDPGVAQRLYGAPWNTFRKHDVYLTHTCTYSYETRYNIDLIEPNNFCAACHGLRPTGSRLFRAV